MTVSRPADLNAAFAEAFNRRDLAALLALYEPAASHCNARSTRPEVGTDEIGPALAGLLRLGGQMVSLTNFCIENGELALLRADWQIRDPAGAPVAAGSSCEIARRQPGGGWLLVVDHADGASRPRV